MRGVLGTVPHWGVGGAAVDDLELVAVHVPWVAASIEVIDYNFDAVRN